MAMLKEKGTAVRRERSEWQRLTEQWGSMGFYERFEAAVAVLLSWFISVVIVVAMFRLGAGIIGELVVGALNPLEHRVFQMIFGEIMTVLIALEFKHSIVRVVARRESIIQVKIVLFIALFAIARKFIILDIDQVTAATLAGLAAVTLALGVTYWLVRERDDRLLRSGVPPY